MIRRGFTLIELLVVITIIGILVSLALPNFIKAKDKALEVQTKSSIHAIQIALERYATDNGGLYPNYIYGGDVASWTNGQGWNALITARPLEPLIWFGYQTSYHRNPFVVDGRSLCVRTNVDPRFGCWAPANSPVPAGGDVLGNILSDPNYPGRDYYNCNPLAEQCGSLSPLPSDNPYGAQQQVIYYFMGDDDTQTVDWIPGEFGYRAYGVTPGIIRQLGTTGGVMRPFAVDHFLLIGYGSVRTNGKDVLHCYGTLNPTGGLGNKPTYFDSIQNPGTNDKFGCRQRGPTAFDPAIIWQNEPGYGGISSQGVNLNVAELPNVGFVPAPGIARATDISSPNLDGRYDGVVAYYSAGTEQATGGTVEQ